MYISNNKRSKTQTFQRFSTCGLWNRASLLIYTTKHCKIPQSNISFSLKVRFLSEVQLCPRGEIPSVERSKTVLWGRTTHTANISENCCKPTHMFCLLTLILMRKNVCQLGKLVLEGWVPSRDKHWQTDVSSGQRHGHVGTAARADERLYRNTRNTSSKHHQCIHNAGSFSKRNQHQTKQPYTTKQVGSTSRTSSRLWVV